jgi:hypothetical protein
MGEPVLWDKKERSKRPASTTMDQFGKQQKEHPALRDALLP